MQRSWIVLAAAIVMVGGATLAADNSAKPWGPNVAPAPPPHRPSDTFSPGPRGTDPWAGGAAGFQRGMDADRAARARAAAAAAAARDAAARARTPPPTSTTPTANWVWPRWQYSNWAYEYYYYPYDGGFGYSYFSPWGYTPYGWTSPYGFPYGMGYPYGGMPYWYPRYAYTPFGPIWYSPFPAAAFMPADQLFGPAPIMRLMGVDQWFNRPAAGWAANQQPPALRPRDQDVDVRAADEFKPHPAAARAIDSAWKLISFGDSYFGNRKFADALDRYRRAAQAAPQVADAWFRQGFANAAMGHYDRAAKAIRHGLEIKPDWASSAFRLDDLFGDDTVAKKNLLDAMLKVAEAEPANADVSLLVGLCYHFDGKPEQASPFLRRAAEVGGNEAAMRNFLDAQQGGGAPRGGAGAGMRE